MPLSDHTGTLDIGDLFDRPSETYRTLMDALLPNATQRLLILTAADLYKLDIGQAHVRETLDVLHTCGYYELDDEMPIPVRVSLRYNDQLKLAPASVLADLSLKDPIEFPRARKSLLTALKAVKFRYDIDTMALTIGRLTQYTATQLHTSLMELTKGDKNATDTHVGRVLTVINDWGLQLKAEQ